MTLNYQAFFSGQLENLFKENRYRNFIYLERLQSHPPYAYYHTINTVSKSPVSIWCSNDYLGLSHHPDMIKAHQETVQKLGTGSGGTRNISGSSYLHLRLEEKIAELHQKQRALLFTSGYVANETTLATLGNNLPNLVFLSDEKNHASLIAGIRSSKARYSIFKHNNLEDLEKKLAALDYNQPKVIVFTSIYSMDGDFSPISDICDLAKQYNALTYLDEVHAVGVYGESGAGLASHMQVADKVDIIQANFSKGFGSFGGYIASTNDCVDFIRSYAPGFIFTTSLPPSIVATSLTALDILKNNFSIQAHYHQRVHYLKEHLMRNGLLQHWPDGHIIPIIINNAVLCTELCNKLLREHHIYVQPINYPTVPKGSERIRVTITPHHTTDLIDIFSQSIKTCWEKISLHAVA